jgi:hypothetical protein
MLPFGDICAYHRSFDFEVAPMLKKLGLVLVLAALSGVASAGGSGPAGESCKIEYFLWFPIEVCTPTGGRGSGPAAAPEIDPASAMTGLALALGGLAVLRGRRSQKSER